MSKTGEMCAVLIVFIARATPDMPGMIYGKSDSQNRGVTHSYALKK